MKSWACLCLVVALAACGKKDVAAKGAPLSAKGAAAPMLDVKGEEHLARAYREIRCALVGGPTPGAGIYRDQGFEDAAAFLDAFAAQAAAHPEWARATLSAAQADPCGGSAASTAAPAPATAAEAPVP